MPCALYWVGAGGRGAWVPDQVLGAAGEGSGAASTGAPGQGRSRGGSPGACGATASPARPGPCPRSRPLRGAPPPPAARPGPGASSRAPVRAPSCHSAPSPAPRILGAAAREPPESSLRRPGRATGPTAASASCCRSAAEKSSRILVWGRGSGEESECPPSSRDPYGPGPVDQDHALYVSGILPSFHAPEGDPHPAPSPGTPASRKPLPTRLT